MSVENPGLAATEGADGASDDFDAGSVIDKFASQLLVEKAEPEAPTAPEAAPAEAESAAPPEPAAEEPKAEEQPKEQPLSAKRLAALARKEAELAAARESIDKQVSDAVEKAKSELRESFLRNPLKFVRDTNVPRERLGQVALLLQAEELGEDAPPEVRTQLQLLQMQAELEALKQPKEPKEQGENEPTPEFRAQVAVTDREIQSVVKDVPSELPFLAEEAAEDPEGTYQALCAIAAPMIKAGQWPSAREIARALNDQLRSDYERLARAAQRSQSASSTQPSPSAKRDTPTTLSDADVTPRASKGPPVLEDTEEYIRRAIAVASKGLVVER